jgi:hypothetical protein
MRTRLRRALLLISLMVWLPLESIGQHRRSDPNVPLGDQIEIVFENRDVIAFGAPGGSQSIRLELGEDVIWYGVQGAVGIVLTDRRVLSVSSLAGSFSETRYLRSERPPDVALLGDRVALIATTERALGYDGGSGNMVEYRYGPQERVLAVRADANIGVVVTDRDLLGMSPFVGGFFTTDFHISERLERVSLAPNLATVTTSRRYLVFRSGTSIWTERKRTLKG